MQRRQFLCSCSGALASVAVPSVVMGQQTPWGITPGKPSTPLGEDVPEQHRDRSRNTPPSNSGGRAFIGCHLTASGRNQITQGRLRKTSGVPQIDEIFTREINIWMLPIFGVRPYCCFYDDHDGANAFATTELLAGVGQGTVAFGTRLMSELATEFAGEWGSGGLHAAGAIFAHEFGHIAQFLSGDSTPGPTMELQADFIAGWYTGLRNLQQAGVGVNFREIAAKMFKIGDFDFKSPNHHGTPQQRVEAYTAGVQYLNANPGANITQALAQGYGFVTNQR